MLPKPKLRWPGRLNDCMVSLFEERGRAFKQWLPNRFEPRLLLKAVYISWIRPIQYSPLPAISSQKTPRANSFCRRIRPIRAQRRGIGNNDLVTFYQSWDDQVDRMTVLNHYEELVRAFKQWLPSRFESDRKRWNSKLHTFWWFRCEFVATVQTTTCQIWAHWAHKISTATNSKTS